MKNKRRSKQEAGKAGGEAKRDNPSKDDSATENPSKDDSATENPSRKIPAQANGNGNVNGNVNENENGNGNEKEKENGNGALFLSPFVKIPESGSDPPDLPPKDYSRIFEEVKSKWKEVTGQETRELLMTIPPAKREKFINTLAFYSPEEIVNAMNNYRFARDRPEEYDIGVRIYGNLFGFLENGVSQFFDDDVAIANFRRQKNDRK
jgi:hypothetical protein